MTNNKELKEVIVTHFDNKESETLKKYGSAVELKSWQEPFEYLEEYLRTKNLNNKTFLDYCCGTGVHSIFPAKLGANVLGIDFSGKSIETAKKRAKIFQVENQCSFKVQDVKNQGIINTKFDFIICVKSLLYLNLDQTFKNLSSLLEDNGELLIIESISGNFFFDLNRMQNTRKINSRFSTFLKKHRSEEIIKNAKKYFKITDLDYFGFSTSISYLLEKKLKISFFRFFFTYLDFFLKKIPFLRKYFFTLVIVLKKN